MLHFALKLYYSQQFNLTGNVVFICCNYSNVVKILFMSNNFHCLSNTDFDSLRILFCLSTTYYIYLKLKIDMYPRYPLRMSRVISHLETLNR